MIHLLTLALFLAPVAMALDIDQFECKATIGWRERSSNGTDWILKESSETFEKSLTDDGHSPFLTLAGRISGNDEELGFYLSVDKKSSVSTLRIGSASLRMPLLSGEQMGWSLGDPYGGADKTVTCRRGGETKVENPTRVTCKALEVVIPSEYGSNPTIRHHKERPLKLSTEFSETTRFGKNGPTVSTSFEKGVAYFWMGEMSEHLVNVFDFSAGPGKSFGIRENLGSYGYSDVACDTK